jgi:hypothetical protein
METPNTASLSGWLRGLGMPERDLVRIYRTFNTHAEAFEEESRRREEAGS